MNTVAAAPEIWVNDQRRPLPGDPTLGALMGELELAARMGVAAAINGAVVPRSAWPTRPLASGDRILVIRATQGG